MTPGLSPYPIAVTEPCSRIGLQHIVDQFKRQGVGFCIVKQSRPHRVAENGKQYSYYKQVLWRAEVPTDKDKVSFVSRLERGRTDGPKPGTKAWDRKIIETWEP